jgi:hypothetical protein
VVTNTKHPEAKESDDGMMPLSIHYYVLSLSSQTSRLYEGFRGTLIHIQNTSFPFHRDDGRDGKRPPTAGLLRDFLRKTDEHLSIYQEQDPLWIVLIGSAKHIAIFRSVTIHTSALIGKVEGDYSAVSPAELGSVVWMVVKHALAGSNDLALQRLENATDLEKIVVGLTAVEMSIESGSDASLFVEEDYHVKLGADVMALPKRGHVSDVIDDAVDLVIESVLRKGGDVAFLDSGTMVKFQRIALIPTN